MVDILAKGFRTEANTHDPYIRLMGSVCKQKEEEHVQTTLEIIS